MKKITSAQLVASGKTVGTLQRLAFMGCASPEQAETASPVCNARPDR